MPEVLAFAGLVAVVAVGGVWIGMLVAPRLGRLADPPDEDEPDDDD